VVTIPASRETIINEVVAVRDGGVLQRRAVPRSQRRTTHTASYAGLLLSNDQGVGNFATYLLDRYAVRQTRFAEVTIYPQHTRQTAATVWPFVFGVQPGWRVQVNRTPNDVGAELTQECFVEGVEHQFDAGGVWSTRLYLVPAIESADDAPWFTIGVSPTGIDPFHF
jgi:CubicO group peptidase (beta-lactamase class C family)